MHFARPHNLYLLLLLVPMALGFAGYFWWKRRVRERLGHVHLIEAMAARHSNRRQVARGVLVMLATALLCVAAAQPQWGQNDRPIKRMGVDVVFAMDLSNSMLAQDIPPSRLDAAKDEISTSLPALGGNRVGLVVFTALSFAQSPLTTDYGAIRFYLEKLQPGQMPVGGTSVGQAILDSVELLTGEEVADNDSDDDNPNDNKHGDSGTKVHRAKNQVIVLITDGEDHESSPLEAAKVAQKHHIHVVTVGMGSPDGSRIPIYDDNGNLKGYKRNQKGELVYTKLDEKTLKGIAKTTGGTYLHYNGKHSVVNGLQKYIDHLQKSELETMLRQRYKNRFMYFLAPALLLLVIAMLLGERRRKPKGAPSRAARTGSMMLILLVLLGGLTGCQDAFKGTVGAVDDGNQLISQKKYQKALDKYHEAETEVPASPELHYDLGVALLGNKKYDQAREAFGRALETKRPELQFDALFNMGLALARQKKWKDAYDTYKQALRVDLDTQKPVNKKRIQQARHNLEVVFRKLFPPCSALEDKLEENDKPGQASKLDKLQKKDLTLCGLDDDWYVIPVTVGSTVSVTANFSQLRDEPDPEHVFLTRPQDLQIGLFDASGKNVLAVDQGTKTAFDPDATEATRSIDKIKVTPDMVSGGKGQLLLKVSAGDQREFRYDLDITAIPPCPALEDKYEDNDTPDAARALDDGEQKLHICPSDDDWYKVDLQMGDTLFVDVKPGEDQERKRAPKLAMDIVRQDTGKVVAHGHADGPYVTAGVQSVMKPGTYLVHVRGATDDEQGPYTTQLYQYAPCVVGDDRFEDNDTAQQAATLDPKKTQFRYLRLCEGDPDYFKLPAPKDDAKGQAQPHAGTSASANPPAAPGANGPNQSKDDKDTKVAWGLRAITDKSLGGAPASDAKGAKDGDRPVQLDLTDASGDQIVAKGVTPKLAAVAAKAGASAKSGTGTKPKADAKAALTAPRFDQVVHYDNKEKKDLLLRVQGHQTFYHLVQLNPKNQNKKNKDKKNKQKNKNKNKNKNKKDKDKNKKNNKNKNKDKNQKGKKKDKQSQKPKKDKKQKKQAQKAKPADKDPKKRRINDILRALEQTDDNFQMKKALQNMPKRYIEKDW